MPIHLNLLAEQKAEEEARRHDPVRQAYLLSGVVVALLVVWSLSLQASIWLCNGKLKTQDLLWQTMATNYSEVTAVITKTKDLNSKLNSLHQLATNRFLVAPALSALQFVPLESVRLTRLKYDLSFASDTKTVGKAKVTQITEKKLLQLNGVLTGNVSVLQAEQFRANLAKNPYFQNELAKTNGIKLWDYAQKADPQNPAINQATFTIDCNYPPIVR
jgi:hypothetical protein